MEAGTFLQGDGAGAGYLATDLAVDGGGGCGDGIEEFDSCCFFHAEVPALHGADDFAMAADDEVARALDGAGEGSEHGEVVTAECGAGDGAGFLDDHVATGLDSAVPMLGDVIVQKADVAAALGALAGLGLGNSSE